MVWRTWITQRCGGRGQLGEAKEIKKPLQRMAWINCCKEVRGVEAGERVGGHREMRKMSFSLFYKVAGPIATKLIECVACIPQAHTWKINGLDKKRCEASNRNTPVSGMGNIRAVSCFRS